MKRILWLGLLLATTAIINAQEWMSADCTMQNGEKIAVFVSGEEAKISYNGDRSQTVTADYKDGVMSVVHIGSRAKFVLSMSIETGDAFGIMLTDEGGHYEYDAFCEMETGTRG